jgi:hypothetical protein
MKSMHLIAQSLLAVLILTLASGCGTTMSQVSLKPIRLTGGQVLPHRVVLVINQELAEYKHEFHLVGGTDVYPLGAALQDYARNVTSNSFQAVDIVPSAEKASSFASDDLILIPRVVKSDTSFGHSKYNISFVMEWTAKDRTSQNTVWLKTITANGSEPMGSVFTIFKHRRMLFQKVFDDLTPKTCKAFQEAPEFLARQP